MHYLQRIKNTMQQVPRRTVIYGVPGVGKSTFAANMHGRDKTIFVQTEDGLANIDVEAFPLAEELMDAWGPVMELGSEDVEHKYKAVVVDSADWLEQLIWNQVCRDGGKNAITDFEFGKGYGAASKIFASYLKALNCCRAKGMHVVVVAHSTIVRVNSPDGSSYDRYAIKLHKDAEALLHEWADEVLFANYETFVKKEDAGFGKSRGIGIGDGKRILKCSERPSHIAKNRLGMPDQIDMRVSEYQKYLKAAGTESSSKNSHKDSGNTEEQVSATEGKSVQWDRV